MLYQSNFTLSHSLDSLGFLPVSPIASQGTFQLLTVAQGVEALLLVKRASGVSELWFNVLAAGLRRFARSMPRDWDAIEPEHLCAFLDTVGGPRSRNNALAQVRQVMKYARRRGWLRGPDPLAGFDPVRVAPPEVGVYTPAQVQQLLTAAPARSRPALALVAFCGVRMAEVCRLPWEAIRWDSGKVLVAARHAKTRSRRLAPLPENAKSWLGGPAEGQLVAAPRRSLEWDLYLAHRESGIPCLQNALRHSFISYRIALLEEEGKVALEAGTSPQMIFKTYRDLVPREAAQAYFEIRPPAPG